MASTAASTTTAAAADKKGLVVVTGASSGIGAAIAKAFSDAGHPTLLLARRTEPMEKLGLKGSIVKKLDVTDEGAFAAAVAEGETEAGVPVACLINNAGCMLLSGDTATQSSKEIDLMLSVNVKGVINGCKAVLTGMKKRGTGTVINISSIAGIKSFDAHAVYCATKFAVHGLTETLRAEVSSSGVRVVTVSPGVVETPLMSHCTDDAVTEAYSNWKSGELKGKALAPEDVARCCYFVFSQPQYMCIRELVLAPTLQKA